jgi:hypothetical protein
VNRREFLTSAGAGALVTAAGRAQAAQSAGSDDRAYWVTALRKLADPILTHLADGTLKTGMPVEQVQGGTRQTVTHLEAVGRLYAGIAPWLELAPDETPEGRLRAEYAGRARRGIERVVHPASPDVLNFNRGSQPLVDAAFLAEGVLRAPRALGAELDADTTRQLVSALESTRVVTPGFNNWLLFSATVEAGLKRLGASYDRMRVDYALRQHDQWYKGDGVYGDGPAFHFDYYNSYVIHPMLLDVLDAVRDDYGAWKTLVPRAEARARRYAAIQERLIAPDGSFPAVGRSIAYRCGAFHLLARAALHRALPDEVSPAQVRGALTAVIRRTLGAPGTFDANGWLRIGLAGHQPGIGEGYISTGSLYLCATAFLPLGLPPSDPFWSAPAAPWTAVKAWSGEPFPIDRAL